MFIGFKVQQHRARSLPLVIHDEFDGWCKLNHCDLVWIGPDLIAQRAHDLGPGVVAGRVHALAAGAPTVDGDQRAVRLFVEHAAQALQPGDGLWSVAHQCFHQVGFIGEMAASHDIQVVNDRIVLRFVGGLDPSLGHHGVCITVAQFGDHQYLSPLFAGE